MRVAATLFALGFLFAAQANAEEPVQIHKLPRRGRALVEAEYYSSTSKDFPYAVEHIDKSMPAPSPRASSATRIPCECGSKFCKISGKKHVGFFWANSWFEMKFDVPGSLEYDVQLRTASPKGTQVNVLSVGPNGETTRLTTIEIPRTGSWSTYTKTKPAVLKLTGGAQTLRFSNVNGGEGANVDYFVFAAHTPKGMPETRPKKNDGPDMNPLKGFSSGWWREDTYSTVGFQYIEWKDLEPNDDQFDWKAVEEILDRPGTKNKHVILQFVCDWDHDKPLEKNYRGPAWLLKKVGEHRGTADPKNPRSRQMRATKYDHPVFIAEAKEAIQALTNRFKDDPRAFVLQTGLLGFWAEWHTFPREDWSPQTGTKTAILKAYLDGIGADGLTQVRYPDEPVNKPQWRMGYTNGSAVPTPHGYEFGKAIAARSLWKNGPVHGEWPPNVEHQYWKRFFQTEEGEQFIQQGHYTTLQAPEHKEIVQQLPGWSPAGRFMKMHKQLGYNFQVQAVRHSLSADGSGRLRVEVDLKNTGIAAFYKNWEVQLGVLESGQQEPVGKPVKLRTDLRKLGPGMSVTLTGVLTEKLDQRSQYQIGLRILQPGADTDAKPWPLAARNTYVVLANDVEVREGKWKDGKLTGGWNILGTLERQQADRIERLRTESSRLRPFDGSFRRARNDDR